MSEALHLLLRVNGAVAAAVVLVMALRLPARRLFGARIAYGLWSLAPLAMLAMLAPARTVSVQALPFAAVMDAAPVSGVGGLPVQTAIDPSLLLDGLWVVGAVASLAWLAWRQLQFGRAVRAGRAGPAVVGVLRPRVVTPRDFTGRYTAREQQVVLAHEAMHIARWDPAANALMALACCLGWFNPLIHVLARYLRIDQELACDAQVVARHPTARRAYAEAMLKAQLAVCPLPIGCYWPAPSVHPLAERIRLLSRRAPGRARRRLGTVVVVLVGLGGACSAWAARPAQVVVVSPPAAASEAIRVRLARAPGPQASSPSPGATRHILLVRPQTDAPAPAAPAPDTPPPAQTQPSLPTRLADAVEALTAFAPNANRRIYAVARRSAVQPGYAVRVLATMTDPDGFGLTTDMTAFGSQARFRTGYYSRRGSRYALFTSVYQRGDLLVVTASLDRHFTPGVSGSVVLRSGETGNVVLGNGQVVTVTPTTRRETPRELQAGEREQRRGGGDF